MWKTISKILGKTADGSDNAVTGLTAQSLMDFFNKKIESVRQSTGGTPVQSQSTCSYDVLGHIPDLYARRDRQDYFVGIIKVVSTRPTTDVHPQGVHPGTTSIHHGDVQWVIGDRLLATQSAPCNRAATPEEDNGRSRRRDKLSPHLKFDIHV